MIESLEDRIAPAAVVHFFEADGDKITVKTNKGTSALLLSIISNQNGVQITEGETGVTSFFVNFLETGATASAFAGTDVKISAAGGSGPTKRAADFVTINGFDPGASGIDFRNVTVKGRLVYIDAGNSDLTTPAIKKLTVNEMAQSDGTDDATVSEILGNIKTISIKDDFDGFIRSEDVNGNPNFHSNDGTRIGSITVKDDIASTDGNDVGHLQVNSIGKLVVKGTFFGPLISGTGCGLIEAVSIDRIAIDEMAINARIVLSS